MRPPLVLGFGGTTSPTSSTLTALRVVLASAEARGAKVELLHAGELALPMYEWGVPPNESVARFVEATARADALVWSSPLYHGTISGLFKNAIDWLELLASRAPAYLTDKPVGLVSVSGGSQSLSAITTMEQIVRSLRGWTVPLVVPVHRAGEVFSKDGAVLDERVRGQLEQLGREVVRAAELFRHAPPRASD
jgi:FMN reductase